MQDSWKLWRCAPFARAQRHADEPRDGARSAAGRRRLRPLCGSSEGRDDPPADRRSTTGSPARARSHVLCVIGLLAGLQGLATPLAGQARVGHIERIAELRENARPVTLKTASDRFSIRRSPSTDWIPIGPETVLYENDRLRVASFVDVRLEVERPAQRGRIVFTHEVRDDEGARVFDVLAGAGPASYSIIPDSTGTGDLGLAIESGALVIDWRGGRLTILAAGHPAVIVSTRVSFAMDAGGDSGYLFVEEGTVAFPASNNFLVQPGQVARLQRGVPPALVGQQATALERATDATRYNARGIWSQLTPFWKKPTFYLPAIGVVAATAAYIITNDNGDDQRGGRITIRIPF